VPQGATSRAHKYGTTAKKEDLARAVGSGPSDLDSAECLGFDCLQASNLRHVAFKAELLQGS